jgi:ubiquinone biosynthesis protein UbiJ
MPYSHAPLPERPLERAAYNLVMVSHPIHWLADFAAPRLLLLFNHVLSSEPVASAKLQAHTGKFIDLNWDAPALSRLPAPLAAVLPVQAWAQGSWRFLITPAGLLEWQAQPAAASAAVSADGASPQQGLTVSLTLDDPLTLARRALKGERPDVKIEGDAGLAETAAWLMKNLRWDVQDDVARWMGNTPAEMLRVAGAQLRDALQRWRPGAGGAATAQTTPQATPRG